MNFEGWNEYQLDQNVGVHLWSIGQKGNVDKVEPGNSKKISYNKRAK